MKTKLTIFASLYLFFYSFSLPAYDHGKVASTMAARHGGQIISSEAVNAHFEMVNTGKLLKLFVYPMDLKTFDSKNFNITVMSETNRAKAKVPADIAYKKGFYEIPISHRKGFKIYLNVTNIVAQKEDLLRFVF